MNFNNKWINQFQGVLNISNNFTMDYLKLENVKMFDYFFGNKPDPGLKNRTKPLKLYQENFGIYKSVLSEVCLT